MVCNFHQHQLPEVMVTLITNCGGVLFTALSLICLITNTAMDLSIRRILLSFTIANLVGTGILTYDTITLICYHGGHRLGFAVTITVTLTVSHLLLLMLAQYIILTSGSKHRANDYIGLILTAWILSITLGMLNVVTLHHEARLVFAIIFLLIALYIVIKYFVIIKIHKKKKKLQYEYKQTYLSATLRRSKARRKCWKLNFVTTIIYSYLCCSIPWVFNELREGMHIGGDSPAVHSIVLIIYSLNFYFPSAICMYMRYIQGISKRYHGIYLTYRYRDMILT